MTIFTLTRPENAVSGTRLGYPCVTDAGRIPSGATVIRWGDSQSPESRSWHAVLNKKSVLQLSVDKLAALESMSRVVKTPEIFQEGSRLPRGRFVVRPASHAEGSDFNVRDGGYVVPTGHHATRLIEPSREYRVWFVRSNYFVAKRVPRTSEGQTADDLCRSKWGYQFQPQCFPKLAEEMAKARQAIPLDFGAVDVLWKDGDGDVPGAYYFLEFNSAPSLDHDRVLGHFQTHLQAILRTLARPEVPTVVPTQENAANRISERIVASPAPSSWEEKYKAKLLAERKAKEAAIYKEVYGDV